MTVFILGQDPTTRYSEYYICLVYMHISGKGSVILGLAPIRILSSQMCGGWFDYFWTLASIKFTMFSTGSVWGGIGSYFRRASSESLGSYMHTGRFEAFSIFFDWKGCVKEVNQFISLVTTCIQKEILRLWAFLLLKYWIVICEARSLIGKSDKTG